MTSLSDIDIRILAALRANSRASLRELANSLNLTVSTLHRRIAQLEKDEIIRRFSIDIDYQSLGLYADCFVLITLKNVSKPVLDFLSDQVLSIPSIYEAHVLMGEYDFLIRVRADSNEELLNTIQSVSSHDVVERTATCISIKSVKKELDVDLSDLLRNRKKNW